MAEQTTGSATAAPWRVVLYSDAARIAAGPHELDQMQEQFGLNTVIMAGAVHLSAQTWALNPVPGAGATQGPGGFTEGDDTVVRTALDEVHRRGMRAWLIGGGYHGGAEATADWRTVDLLGRPYDGEAPRWTMEANKVYCACPCHPRLHDFMRAAYAEVAGRYEYDGSALTHVRYWQAGVYTGLQHCGCAHCQKRAGELGYDFAAMRHAVLEVARALRGVPTRALRQAAATPFTTADFLHLLSPHAAGLVAWLTFRCRTIADSMADMGQAAREAAGGRSFAWGMDTHFPAFARLVGHDYALLSGSLDQMVPLLCHVAIHGYQQPAAYAQALVDTHPDLSEGDALRITYRLFGWDGLGLPETAIDALNALQPDTSETGSQALVPVLKAELAKARILGGDTPMYPVLKGRLWPQGAIQELTTEARRLGFAGITYQGTDLLGRWVAEG